MGFFISDKNLLAVGLCVYEVDGLWYSFVRIDRDEDGRPISFFVKLSSGEEFRADSVEELARLIA